MAIEIGQWALVSLMGVLGIASYIFIGGMVRAFWRSFADKKDLFPLICNDQKTFPDGTRGCGFNKKCGLKHRHTLDEGSSRDFFAVSLGTFFPLTIPLSMVAYLGYRVFKYVAFLVRITEWLFMRGSSFCEKRMNKSDKSVPVAKVHKSGDS